MKKKIMNTGEHIAAMSTLLIVNAKDEDLKDINVAWVARKLNVSYKYLSRSFIREYEMHLIDFIDGHKLVQAFRLLNRNPKIKTKEIAEIFGYSSSNYFIKSFKKNLGIPPQVLCNDMKNARLMRRKCRRK